MKIKCPFCDFVYQSKLLMYSHFATAHIDEALKDYTEKIFKIHEEKNRLQSKIKDNHFEECVKLDHDFETHQEIAFAIEELESILENNKK